MSLSSPRRRRTAPAIAVCVLATSIALTGCSSSSKNTKTTTTGAAQTQLETSIDALIKTGIADATAGHLTEADATFENVISLDKANKFAYYNLGVIAGLQKNDALALKDYNTALSIDTSYTPALYNKAIILESTDINQAISIYESIVALNPKAATAYLRLSYAYAQIGKTSNAADARAKAISLDKSLADVPGPSSSPSAS